MGQLLVVIEFHEHRKLGTGPALNFTSVKSADPGA